MPLDIKIKWEFAATNGYGYMQSAVVAADADLDGECEVFVGSYTYSLYCLNGKDGSVKWKYDLPQDLPVRAPHLKDFVGCNNLSLADLDGDGRLEVIFGTEPCCAVYALRTEGASVDRLMWRTPLVGAFIAGGLGCFADTDGRYKVIALTRWMSPEEDGRAYLLDGFTGRIIWGPIGEQDVCSSGPSVADLNGDGALEFVHGNHRCQDIPLGGHVVCRSVKDGSLLWTYQTPDDNGYVTMPLCDVNNDGRLEVVAVYGHYEDVVPPAYGLVVLSGSDGKELLKTEKSSAVGFCPAIGSRFGKKTICCDALLDGRPVLVCYDGETLDTIWQAQMDAPAYSPLALDLNGDGVDDYIVGDNNNGLAILDGVDGRVLFKERYVSEKKITPLSIAGIRNLCAADVDGDGNWEILFNSQDGRTRCLGTNAPVPAGAGRSFPMQGGSILRTGVC